MKIRRVNDTTINCIITEQDLKESGLALHDLFDRKKEAMEFIRNVITSAAQAENFSLQEEFTSMQVRVLSDQSVSLTLSHDPARSENIREICKAVREQLSAEEEKERREKEKVFLFRFSSLLDVTGFCRELRAARGTKTSLYKDQQGDYYLFLERNTSEPAVFTAQSLQAGEFGELVTCDRVRADSMREHLEPVLRSDVIRTLCEL